MRLQLLPLLLVAMATQARADDGNLTTVILIGVGAGLVVAVLAILVARKCLKRKNKALTFEDFVEPMGAMEAPRRVDKFARYPARETEATSPSESLHMPTMDGVASMYKAHAQAMPTSPVGGKRDKVKKPEVSYRYKVEAATPGTVDYGLDVSPPSTPQHAPRAPPKGRDTVKMGRPAHMPMPAPAPSAVPQAAPAVKPTPAKLRVASGASHHSSPRARQSLFDSPIELPPAEAPKVAPRLSKQHMTPEMRAAKKAALINQLGSSKPPVMSVDPPRRPSVPKSVTVALKSAPPAITKPVQTQAELQGQFLPLPAAPTYAAPVPSGPAPAPRFDMAAAYPEDEQYLTCVDNANDTLPLGAEAGTYNAAKKSALIHQLERPGDVAATRDVLNKSFLSSEQSLPLMEDRPRHFELRSSPPRPANDMIYLAPPPVQVQSEFAQQLPSTDATDYYPFGDDVHYETSLNTVDTLPLGMEAGAYTKGQVDVAEYERKQRLKRDQIKHLEVKVRIDRPQTRYYDPRG
ncbi:hypothetical protein ACHHYP_09297 [Achlya hypogyna]|uniref:Secreted protein n=1 Tax=Achlya hypogyna TaxID=1202772 RepID=A0A1V9YNH2_ACHHY|nr:hypothetical protein ACHHYP_09297 [Achlya hypogyna]